MWRPRASKRAGRRSKWRMWKGRSMGPWRSSDLCLVSFRLWSMCLGVMMLFPLFFCCVCFLAVLGRRRRCETLTMTAQAGPGVGKGYTGGKGPLFSLLAIAKGSGMLPLP